MEIQSSGLLYVQCYDTHTHVIVEGVSQAVSVGATVYTLVHHFPCNFENFKVIFFLFIDIFIVMNNN